MRNARARKTMGRIFSFALIACLGALGDVEAAERRITLDPGVQREPAISGSRIVWTDERNGQRDIYLFDLATNTERRLTADPSEQSQPAISGSRVVWTDYRSGGGDIFLYDVATNVERQLSGEAPPELPSTQRAPAISGNYVVWQDYRTNCGAPSGSHAPTNISLYDIAAKTQRRIVSSCTVKAGPAISGSLVLWAEKRESIGMWEIRAYDVSTQAERLLTTTPLVSLTAHVYLTPRLALSGSRVVWDVFANGRWDIVLYDSITNTQRAITADAATQLDPAMSGSRILWQDLRHGNADVFLYDVTRGLEQAFVVQPSEQSAPDIAGCRAVWVDDRNGAPDVYLAELAGTNLCETRLDTDVAVINSAGIPYTADLFNNTTSTMYNVVLQATVEQGATRRAAGGIALGTLAPGQQRSVRAAITVNDKTASGSGTFMPGPATVSIQLKQTNGTLLSTMSVPIRLAGPLAVDAPVGGVIRLDSTQVLQWHGGHPSWPLAAELLDAAKQVVQVLSFSPTPNDGSEAWLWSYSSSFKPEPHTLRLRCTTCAAGTVGSVAESTPFSFALPSNLLTNGGFEGSKYDGWSGWGTYIKYVQADPAVWPTLAVTEVIQPNGVFRVTVDEDGRTVESGTDVDRFQRHLEYLVAHVQFIATELKPESEPVLRPLLTRLRDALAGTAWGVAIPANLSVEYVHSPPAPPGSYTVTVQDGALRYQHIDTAPELNANRTLDFRTGLATNRGVRRVNPAYAGAAFARITIGSILRRLRHDYTPVGPGRRYRVTAAMKTEGTPGPWPAYVEVQFFTGGGSRVATYTVGATPAGVTPWHRVFNVTPLVVPSNAAKVRVNMVTPASSSGSASFDDVTLWEVQ